jgi:hypothetical protein
VSAPQEKEGSVVLMFFQPGWRVEDPPSIIVERGIDH